MTRKLLSALLLSLAMIGFAHASDDEAFDQEPAPHVVAPHQPLRDDLLFPGLMSILSAPIETHFAERETQCTVCPPEEGCFAVKLEECLGLEDAVYSYFLCPEILRDNPTDNLAIRLFHQRANQQARQRLYRLLASGAFNETVLEVGPQIIQLAEQRKQSLVRGFALLSTFILTPEQLKDDQKFSLLCKLGWIDPEEACRANVMQHHVSELQKDNGSPLVDLLPPENIAQVCELLDTNSLRNFALTSRFMLAVIREHIVGKRLMAIREQILARYHSTHCLALEPLFSPLSYVITKQKLLTACKIDLDERMKRRMDDIEQGFAGIASHPCEECSIRKHFIQVGKAWHDVLQEMKALKPIPQVEADPLPAREPEFMIVMPNGQAALIPARILLMMGLFRAGPNNNNAAEDN